MAGSPEVRPGTLRFGRAAVVSRFILEDPIEPPRKRQTSPRGRAVADRKMRNYETKPPCL